MKRRLRLFPGSFTVLAAVAAAVIVLIAINRPQPPPSTTATNTPSATAATCPHSIGSVTGDPPRSYRHRSTATDASRPGQTLIIAASSTTIQPGGTLTLFTELSIPQSSLGATSSARTSASIAPPPARVAALPCLAVSGDGSITPDDAGTAGTVLLTVPAGASPGSTVVATASIPRNYPAPGEASVAASLTISVKAAAQ